MEVSVQGVYVPGGKCPGGKCPWGICPWGKCLRVHVWGGGLCPRTLEYIYPSIYTGKVYLASGL